MGDFKFIDMHCHMFNSLYVPVAEVLNHKYKLPRLVAIPLGRVLVANIDEPEPLLRGEKPRWLEVMCGDATDVDSFTDMLLERSLKKLGMTESLPPESARLALTEGVPPLLQDLDEIARQYALETGEGFDENQLNDRLRQLFSPGAASPLSPADYYDLGKLMGERYRRSLRYYLSMAVDGLQFVGTMMVNDQELSRNAAGGIYAPEERPLFSLFLTMDIGPIYQKIDREHGYRYHSPNYDMIEAHWKRSGELARAQNGRLIGMVAFDPHRGRAALDNCKKALAQGYIGVKVYPPLGYRPNDFESFPTLAELYEYCQEEKNDIPILTHCTPVGFQAYSGQGIKSNPNFWKLVLKEYPKLRLCFGHAGAGYYKVKDEYGREFEVWGWYSPDERVWDDSHAYAAEVVRLCQEFENVYADFSYLEAMIDNRDSERECFLQNMRRALAQRPPDVRYHFGDKMIYGSDWHMSGMIGRPKEYLRTFRTLFQDKDLRQYTDKFFYLNALRYLRFKDWYDGVANSGKDLYPPEALAHLKYIYTLA